MFDFESYKRLFKKSYSGAEENMLRAKLFMSRALRVFISATKYRFRQVQYYKALNHLSDRTREELDRMTNRVLKQEADTARAGRQAAAPIRGHSNTLPPDFVAADGVDPIEVLRRVLDARRGEPAADEMRAQLDKILATGKSPHRRQRIDVASANTWLRELPLNKLISAPGNSSDPNAKLPAATRAKIRDRPASNNPFYEEIELSTRGLDDQQVALPTLDVMGS